MKKYLIRLAVMAAVLLLAAGCGEKSGSTGDEKSFQAKILEIYESGALVEALEGEEIRSSADQFTFGTADLENIGAGAGDVVNITFTGDIMESYPAQIQAVSWSVVQKASDTEEKGGATDNSDENVSGVTALPERRSECSAITFSVLEPAGPGSGTFEMSYTGDSHDTIWYYDEFFSLERYTDGKWEEIPMLEGLCGMTSYTEIPEEFPEELDLSWSYLYGPLEPGIYCATKDVFPQRIGVLNELMSQSMRSEQEYLQKTGPDTDAGVPVYAVFELKEGLGLSLKVKSASSTGLTLEFVRDGGSPAGELQYGSRYWLQRLEDGRWSAVEYADMEHEIVWTEVAYNIPEEGSVQDVDWEWLYGQLPAGQYRIFKDVMDFRETGDYDMYSYSAEFEIL